MMDDQLDLLDQIAGETRGNAAQDRARKQFVLTALRDQMRHSLQFVAALGPDWQPHYSTDENTGRVGERIRSAWDWQGISVSAKGQTGYISWDELAGLIEDHPDRPCVVEFYTSVPHEKSERFAQHSFACYRPFELMPEGAPHQSWIDSEHARPGWDDRLETWKTTIKILNDAMKEVEA